VSYSGPTIRQPKSAVSSGDNPAIAENSDPQNPKRVMGFRDLLLFYVVTGVSLRWIASAAAAGPSSIIIWLGAWLFFYTPLALSVIELSSRYPNEGGVYVWTKRAFGDFSGFMAAWTYWTSNLPYFPAVLYFAASNVLYIRQSEWSYLSANSTFFIIFALLTLSTATLLNIVGLNVGKWLHNIGALSMWIPVLIVVGLGLLAYHRFGSATTFSLHTMKPSLHFNDIIFWSVLMFAFSGCDTASLMGGEIKNPRRSVPWALVFAGLTVAFCYIMGTVGVLLALPSTGVNALEGLVQAVAATAHRVGLPGILPIAAFLIALSNVGASGAYLAAIARLPFVAGIDRYLPTSFGALHPRWKTPWVALLTQSFIGAVFIFLGQAGTSVKGAYDVLVSMGVITYFIPYLYLFASLLKLQSEAANEDVIRVPGGKLVAYAVGTMGFVVTLLTILLSALPPADEPNKPLAIFKIVGGCGGLVFLGILLYWSGKRRKRLAEAVEVASARPV
jgi:amino acid transporter